MKKILSRFLSYLFFKLKIVQGHTSRNDRFGAIYKAWGHVFTNHIVGDYVEFGVYKGESVVAALQSYAEFYSWLSSQKRSPESWRRGVAGQSPLNDSKPVFHCFDTFCGMPDNNEENITFAQSTFMKDLDKVKKNINKSNKLGRDVQYYPGLFRATSEDFKKRMNGRRIAIANIDCDLKESAVDALDAIKDYIDIGTILLFDDYNAFNADRNKGERKAFSEFERTSDFVFEKWFTYHFMGQSFLVTGKKDS